MEQNTGGNKVVTLARATLRSSSFWRVFAGTAAGAAGGFLLYYFVWCRNGSCMITSNPWLSILWGSLFGFFITKK